MDCAPQTVDKPAFGLTQKRVCLRSEEQPAPRRTVLFASFARKDLFQYQRHNACAFREKIQGSVKMRTPLHLNRHNENPE